MKQPDPSRQSSLGVVVLAGTLVLALGLAGMPYFAYELRLLTGSGQSLASYELATWGNTLIGAAAVLYVANRFMALEPVGRGATLLAAGGASLLVVDTARRLLDVTVVPTNTQDPYMGQYNLISVVVPMVVIWYLAIERATRDRTAGAFFMPPVLCLVGVEMWLLAQNAGDPSVFFRGLLKYWGHAYLVAHVIGYGAFAAAGAMGLLYLVRFHLQSRGIRPARSGRWLPDAWRAQRLILAAFGTGVPVFGLALFFAAGWGFGAGREWITYAWFKGLWVASALALYGGLLYVLYTRSVPSQRLAWWAVLGFAATLALFLGVHVLTFGLTPLPLGA